MTLGVEDRRGVAAFLYREVGFTAAQIAPLFDVTATVIELDVNPQRRAYTRARSRAGKRHRRWEGTNRDRGRGNIRCAVCDMPLAVHDQACVTAADYAGRGGRNLDVSTGQPDDEPVMT